MHLQSFQQLSYKRISFQLTVSLNRKFQSKINYYVFFTWKLHKKNVDLFSMIGPRYMNFGEIGYIVGHEIIHGAYFECNHYEWRVLISITQLQLLANHMLDTIRLLWHFSKAFISNRYQPTITFEKDSANEIEIL